jgi:hypothetical protein
MNGISEDKDSRLPPGVFYAGKYFYAFVLQESSLFVAFLIKKAA